MAILSGPQNVGLVGYKQYKPTAVTANPFIHVAGQSGNPQYSNAPAVVQGQAVGPVTPAAVAAPPPPPPPPDFDALTKSDAQYTQGKNLLDRDNTLTTAALKQAWLRNSQSYGDSANAHGALFSGAAAQGAKNIDQQHLDDVARQQLNYDRGGHDLYFSVFNRLKEQLTPAGGLA